MKQFLDTIRHFQNFYAIVGIVFFVWMVGFDSNDVGSQWHNYQKLREAKAEKKYYAEKIVEVRKDRAELLSSPRLLEKFAREKYLMKKPNEDLYIVVPADEN